MSCDLITCELLTKNPYSTCNVQDQCYLVWIAHHFTSKPLVYIYLFSHIVSGTPTSLRRNTVYCICHRRLPAFRESHLFQFKLYHSYVYRPCYDIGENCPGATPSTITVRQHAGCIAHISMLNCAFSAVSSSTSIALLLSDCVFHFHYVQLQLPRISASQAVALHPGIVCCLRLY